MVDWNFFSLSCNQIFVAAIKCLNWNSEENDNDARTTNWWIWQNPWKNTKQGLVWNWITAELNAIIAKATRTKWNEFALALLWSSMMIGVHIKWNCSSRDRLRIRGRGFIDSETSKYPGCIWMNTLLTENTDVRDDHTTCKAASYANRVVAIHNVVKTVNTEAG